MKKIIYFFEFIFIYIFFNILYLLPINLVSLIGETLFKLIGPLTKSHKTALNNYKKVFKNLDNKIITQDIINSWGNLGKTFIEISILNKLVNKKNNRIKIIGKEHLTNLIKKEEQVIFFGIHQANWELLVPCLDKIGIKVGAIYRHINNPFINNYILKKRSSSLTNNETFYTPKGEESARKIIKAINEKFSMILLIDQKDSAGTKVEFLNNSAKTQLGFLKIARKYNLKLVPVQNIREKINNFSIKFHPPIEIFERNISDVEAINKIHNIIEKWIIKNPTQWFWQHNRFG
tara:strand:- start:1338 stop:2207 length:870 start_codon:yes stop_codon:yes gene_type:complete